MMANEERLALILEANDKATAVLQKVRKEIEATDGAAGKSRKGTSELGNEFDKLSDGKLVKSARAMSSIAYAAQEAKLGGREAARSMGELAENLAIASGNAKFAGWAIGINAAIIAMVTFVGLLRDSAEQTKPTELFIRRLSHLTADQAQSEIAGLRTVRDNLIEQTAKEADAGYFTRLKRMFTADLTTKEGRAVARQGGVDFEKMDHTNANFEELQRKALLELNEGERKRVLALQDQTLEMSKQKNTELELGRVRVLSIHHQTSSLELARAEALGAKKNADQQVDAMFRFRDANGQIHQLTAAELALKGKLLENNRQSLGLAIQTAKAKYDEQIAETTFSQQQGLWYARRRLAQNDYQTSLDGIRQQHEQQIHAIQISDKLEADKTAEIARANDLYVVQLQLLDQQHELQTRMLRAQNNVDASNSSLIGPGDLMEQHKAKMDFIEEERLAAIKRGEDETQVNRKAYNDRRALIRSEIDQTRQGYRTIEDALLSSHSRQLKAIGHAMQAFRRLEIGAEASMAAVESARAFGKVPGYLAAGQIASAALSAASGVQLAAAAALGFREALGGGGGGAGGGGSSSVSGAGTFEPRNGVDANGGVTVNLYQKDPFGRDQIKQTLFYLQRAGVTRTAAAEITPSSGLVGR